MTLPRYVVLNKVVGETPLECAEHWRTRENIPADIPLAYAGRLDPMASGKLLVLVGDECKRQNEYHHLDKGYNFSVLLDVGSDTGDVLGIVTGQSPQSYKGKDFQVIARTLTGSIALPYPHYSARTVDGKPLHTWAVEGKINTITIPVKHSRVYNLRVTGYTTLSRQELVEAARAKIDSLPPVIDPRKALGNDFRRPLVHAAWDTIAESGAPTDNFTIVHFHCIASSGTYMRSLAEEIGKRAGTRGLAFSIHRTQMGHFVPVWGGKGFWRTTY